MTENPDDLKNRLRQHAEASVDRLLEQKAGRRDLSMTEMEDLVGQLEMELRQALMQELVNEAQIQDVGLCPECSGKLRYKGKKRKQVIIHLSMRSQDVERKLGRGYQRKIALAAAAFQVWR